MANVSLSVVNPAFYEAPNIGALVRETVECLPRHVLHEIIVVDDASDDTTAAEVQSIFGDFLHLRYVHHARRCGQSAAIRSGVRLATGELIAPMDGDGQNDPRDILKLMTLHETGGARFALAGGVRVSPRATSSKRLASRFANWLRNAILNDQCRIQGAGSKSSGGTFFSRCRFFSGMHRYLPALVLAYGHEAA